MTTRIEWAGETWNPVLGCERISAGCANCYAERYAGRRLRPEHEGLTFKTPNGRRWTGEVKLLPERLEQPLRWKKPRRVFVVSMGDLFHERVPRCFLDRVFGTIRRAEQHTFILLSKRIAHALTYAQSFGEFPPNVQMGATIEDQAALEERAPLLLQIPAPVIFFSCEPLLAPIDLRLEDCLLESDHYPLGARLGGVIIGGESGAGARPSSIENIRYIVRQCDAAGVPPYVKQLGSRPYKWNSAPVGVEWLKLRSYKGADPAEWPPDLRRRELPAAPRAA